MSEQAETPLAPEWNSGSWFGPQVGTTAWIAVAGAMTLFHDVRTGIVVLALCAATNLVGWQLWRQRERRSYFGALKLFVLLAGVSGVLTIFAVDRAGLWETIQTGGTVPAGFTYVLIVALTVGLAIFFHFRERQAQSPTSK